MIGKVIKKHGGFYEVLSDALYLCRLSGKHRFKNGEFIVCGDEVDFIVDEDKPSDLTGYIVDILPRKNFIIRPGVANIDQLLIVSAVKMPSYDFYLLDKMIVLAKSFDIHPILCFNKTDLATQQELNLIAAYYEHADIPIYYHNQFESIEHLREIFSKKTTALTGNSGVGKSTIVNQLLGSAQQDVNEISIKLNRGKHTTRTAELFSIQDSFVIDTPGFSALAFPDDFSKDDLKYHYSDFYAHHKDCKFSNCNHINEPNCYIKELLKTGWLPKERYENYVKLFNEINSTGRR